MMNVGAVAITVDVDAAKALARIEELKARLGNLRKSFKDITGESKETAQALKLQADLQARLASEAEKARAAMAGGFAALGEVKRSAEQVAPQLSRMSQLFAEMRARVLGVGQALKSVDWKGEIGKSKETLEKQAGAIAALTMAFGAQDTKVGQVIRSVGGMAAAYGSMGPLGVALAATATAVNLLDEHYASVLAKQDEMIAKSHTATLKALESTKEVRDLSKQVLDELSSVGLSSTEKRVAGINKMIAAQQAELDTLVKEHQGLGWNDDNQKAKETYQTNIKHLQDQALHVQLLGKAVEEQARIDEAKRKREAEAQAYDADLRERLLQATGKLNKEQERSLRISAEVLKQVPTATRAEMDSWNQSGNALEGAPVVWRQFDEVTQAQLDRETGVDNGLNGPVVWDWDKSQADADAARAMAKAIEDSKAFSNARLAEAGTSIGESIASGSIDVSALGNALGAAAGVPIAGAVIGVVSTIGSIIGTVVSGTIGKLFESKGAQGFFEAAGTAAAAVAAAMLLLYFAVALMGPVLLLSLVGLAISIWPVTLAFLALAVVLAPLLILGGLLLTLGGFLVVFMAALGTQTKAFANIQMVIGRAFEALALPLGGFWQALEPLAGAMMQGANAFSQILAPLAPLLAAFIGLDKVTWFLVSTIAVLGKFISAVIATLARALDDLIDLIELVTGTDIKGEKGLKAIAKGADIAYGQFDAITVDSGQDEFNDLTGAMEDNTSAIKDMTASLTNIPSGYRVEGAMFDSQTPERRGGSGGNARHRNAGDARMARGGGTVIIKNLTVQARNRRILDEIGDEVRRRYGTDRLPTGPLDDDG